MSILDPLNIDERDDINAFVNKMLEDASGHHLPPVNQDEQVITNKFDTFLLSFLSEYPAKVDSLQIDLTSDAEADSHLSRQLFASSISVCRLLF